MPYNVACPLFYLLITILSPYHTTKKRDKKIKLKNPPTKSPYFKVISYFCR